MQANARILYRAFLSTFFKFCPFFDPRFSLQNESLEIAQKNAFLLSKLRPAGPPDDEINVMPVFLLVSTSINSEGNVDKIRDGPSPFLVGVVDMRRIITHKLKWDDEGVASTVGTIMALLVFLTFLSMIVNSYVPVWMKDSESSHMNVAFGQFGDLKEAIDMQTLGGRIAEIAGQPFIPITTFTPITLGVDGVPIFAAPTLGTLIADQDAAPWNAWFHYYPSKYANISHMVNESAKGSISLAVYNRYFVQQTLVYESGGVLKHQYDGQVLRAEPTFEVRVVNNTEDITMVLISLLGYGSMEGTTTEGVHAKVISVSTEEYKRTHTDIYINHTSIYGLAWFQFYNNTLNKAFGLTTDDYDVCDSDYCYTIQTGGLYGVISRMIRSPYFRIHVQLNQTSNQFNLVVQLKNDHDNSIPLTMPISSFRIQKVIVNMAVGGLGARVNI